VLDPVAVQVVPQRRHGGRGGGPQFADHLREVRGLQIPVDHDQVGAGDPGGVRPAPGVGVEHRYDGQYPVGVGETKCAPGRYRQGMQVDRAVAVGDALGRPAGAGGVAQRGGRALRQLRPVAQRRGGRDELGVVVHADPGGATIGLTDHDDVTHRGQPVDDPLQRTHQVGVDQDHRVAGVVDDVGELIVVQPQIQRVQHRAHARHRKIGRQVRRGVPGQRGDHVAVAHAQPGQRAGESFGLVGQLGEAPGGVFCAW
jgi:hypothetical protein